MTREKHIGYTSIDNILYRYFPQDISVPTSESESIQEPTPTSVKEEIVPEIVIQSPSSSSLDNALE